MLRRLWIRYLLWVNNVCPEHGNMLVGFGPGGTHHYCPECNERYRTQVADDLVQLRREYNDATKP